MQDSPHFLPLLGQPPLIVMELRQSAVAPFDRRGGALKGVDLLPGPRLPVLQGLRRQPQGEGMLVKRGFSGLPYPPQLGFPASAARMPHLVLPIDPWQEDLSGPLPPWRGKWRLFSILPDAFPPEIHQRSQGRQLVTDLLHGVVTYWDLMPLG